MVLVVAAVAMVGTLPGRTQGLGLVTEPLMGDLRINRLDYAQLNLWATLIGSGFAIAVGGFIDRLGVRVVLTAVAVALGAVVISRAAGPHVTWRCRGSSRCLCWCSRQDSRRSPTWQRSHT